MNDTLLSIIGFVIGLLLVFGFGKAVFWLADEIMGSHECQRKGYDTACAGNINQDKFLVCGNYVKLEHYGGVGLNCDALDKEAEKMNQSVTT